MYYKCYSVIVKAITLQNTNKQVWPSYFRTQPTLKIPSVSNRQVYTSQTHTTKQQPNKNPPPYVFWTSLEIGALTNMPPTPWYVSTLPGSSCCAGMQTAVPRWLCSFSPSLWLWAWGLLNFKGLSGQPAASVCHVCVWAIHCFPSPLASLITFSKLNTNLKHRLLAWTRQPVYWELACRYA